MATTYGATDEHPDPSPPHSAKRPEEKNAINYDFNLKASSSKFKLNPAMDTSQTECVNTGQRPTTDATRHIIEICKHLPE